MSEPTVCCLIPAYNESASITSTLIALSMQKQHPDLVVVVADNCTDDTLAKAKVFQDFPAFARMEVIAVASVDNKHKKSGALNWAWNNYAQYFDLTVCLDADTVLPPNAIADWKQEFVKDELLAGSSSKFTMRGVSFLVRLQRAEFSKWCDSSLKRGWTSVLAGTGCAIRNTALTEVVRKAGTEGPWDYSSQVEDFLLTYRIRELGYKCHVSPTVRAYTDAMKDFKSLWNQRMKWQVGTVEDLMSIGVNKLTWLDWRQQAAGMLSAAVRLVWLISVVIAVITGTFHFSPIWLFIPFLFVANDIKQALRIPHRDTMDVVLAATLLPQEVFAWMRSGWFTKAYIDVMISKITGRRKDRWALQYQAEGVS